MLTSLFLSSVLFAPAAPAAPQTNEAPAAKEAAPAAATGTAAPRIVELKPDADGKVKITVMRPKQMPNVIRLGNPGGNPGPGGAGGAAIMIQSPEKVELTDVKNLTITTATGKDVKLEDAFKTLAKGGFVVVSADGKRVSLDCLKMFKDDVLVLSSPELVGAGNAANIFGAQGWVLPVNPGGAPRNRVPAPADPAPPKIQ